MSITNETISHPDSFNQKSYFIYTRVTRHSISISLIHLVHNVTAIQFGNKVHTIYFISQNTLIEQFTGKYLSTNYQSKTFLGKA